jgi:ABC-type transport system involved in multi-copper enzyme maturation permease subunit
VVTAACALPLLFPNATDLGFVAVVLFGGIGFFVGIPMLTVLPWAREFQHGTLPLLLSQPVKRSRIWSEKLLVAAAVAVPGAVLYVFSSWTGFRYSPGVGGWNATILAAWHIVTVCSAPFCALRGGSSTVGVGLTLLTQFVVWTPFPIWQVGGGLPYDRLLAFAALGFVAFGCSGAVLGIGRRTLRHFEVVHYSDVALDAGGGSWRDSIITRLVPGRPGGVIPALIRKELRILWPMVWMTPLMVTGLVSLPATIVSGSSSWVVLAVLITAAVFVLYLAIVVFPGFELVGAERSFGTHSWSLSLPVPVWRQWLTKILVAFGMCLTCSLLAPALATTVAGKGINVAVLLWEAKLSLDGPGLQFSLPALFLILILFVASFWCACAMKDSVRAVVLFLPVIVGVILAGLAGSWFADEVMSSMPRPLTQLLEFIAGALRLRAIVGNSYVLILPTLIFAFVQSYWLYRRQPEDGFLPTVWALLPVAAVAFFSGFCVSASQSL